MLGKELKKKRESMGLTLAQMSEKSGYVSGYLSDIENNRRAPKNGATLKKIAKGYDIDFDRILELICDYLRWEADA